MDNYKSICNDIVTEINGIKKNGNTTRQIKCDYNNIAEFVRELCAFYKKYIVCCCILNGIDFKEKTNISDYDRFLSKFKSATYSVSEIESIFKNDYRIEVMDSVYQKCIAIRENLIEEMNRIMTELKKNPNNSKNNDEKIIKSVYLYRKVLRALIKIIYKLRTKIRKEYVGIKLKKYIMEDMDTNDPCESIDRDEMCYDLLDSVGLHTDEPECRKLEMSESSGCNKDDINEMMRQMEKIMRKEITGDKPQDDKSQTGNDALLAEKNALQAEKNALQAEKEELSNLNKSLMTDNDKCSNQSLQYAVQLEHVITEQQKKDEQIKDLIRQNIILSETNDNLEKINTIRDKLEAEKELQDKKEKQRKHSVQISMEGTEDISSSPQVSIQDKLQKLKYDTLQNKVPLSDNQLLPNVHINDLAKKITSPIIQTGGAPEKKRPNKWNKMIDQYRNLYYAIKNLFNVYHNYLLASICLNKIDGNDEKNEIKRGIKNIIFPDLSEMEQYISPDGVIHTETKKNINTLINYYKSIVGYDTIRVDIFIELLLRDITLGNISEKTDTNMIINNRLYIYLANIFIYIYNAFYFVHKNQLDQPLVESLITEHYNVINSRDINMHIALRYNVEQNIRYLFKIEEKQEYKYLILKYNNLGIPLYDICDSPDKLIKNSRPQIDMYMNMRTQQLHIGHYFLNIGSNNKMVKLFYKETGEPTDPDLFRKLDIQIEENNIHISLNNETYLEMEITEDIKNKLGTLIKNKKPRTYIYLKNFNATNYLFFDTKYQIDEKTIRDIINPNEGAANMEQIIDKMEIKLNKINKLLIKHNNIKICGPVNNVFKREKNKHISEKVQTNILNKLESMTDIFLFSYGCSGSGKTSILIEKNVSGNIEPGIIPLALKEKRISDTFSNIEMKFIEIYGHMQSTEDSRCKLGNNDINYTLSWDNLNLNWKTTDGKTVTELILLHMKDENKRKIYRTPFNPVSSRSHMLLFIKLQNKNTKKNVFLITGDLAGIEIEFPCKDINFLKKFIEGRQEEHNHYVDEINKIIRENDDIYKLEIERQDKIYNKSINIYNNYIKSYNYKMKSNHPDMKPDKIKNHKLYVNKIIPMIFYILGKKKDIADKLISKDIYDHYTKFPDNTNKDYGDIFTEDEFAALSHISSSNDISIKIKVPENVTGDIIRKGYNFMKIEERFAILPNPGMRGNKMPESAEDIISSIKDVSKNIEKSSNINYNYDKNRDGVRIYYALLMILFIKKKELEREKYDIIEKLEKEKLEKREEKINDKLSEICNSRLYEGYCIVDELLKFQEDITFLVNYKIHDSIVFPCIHNACTLVQCNKYSVDCIGYNLDSELDKIKRFEDLKNNISFGSLLFQTIRDVIAADNKDGNTLERLKKMALHIYLVLNLEESENNPPPIPYIDIRQLKNEYLNMQSKLSNIIKMDYVNEDGEIFKNPEHLAYFVSTRKKMSRTISNLENYNSKIINKNHMNFISAQSEYELYNLRNKIQNLGKFIKEIDRYNAINILGTVDFMAQISAFNMQSIYNPCDFKLNDNVPYMTGMNSDIMTDANKAKSGYFNKMFN